MNRYIFPALKQLPTLMIGLLLPLLIISPTVSAVAAKDWDAGRIIDDALFYDNNSMSVSDIQAFLNAQVPSCDTNGTAQNSTNTSMTDAQYAASQGWPGPPYICLKDYYQVPRSDVIQNNYSGSIPSGAISAAQIIKNAADTYHISPKVLLTTLQKESPGPLITDNWPLESQYKNAMGYGCPDSAPCDPSYAGFYNQVNNAAWQFNQYKTNPTSFRYQPLTNNTILYNPNTNCGSSNVYIENYATAGLYNYTPYQPNAAALNNLYGSGDSCSSYGNRNFWRIYNDWFNPIASLNNGLSMTIVSQPDATPARGQDVTYTISLTNNFSSAVTLDAVGIVGRLGDVYTGANRDFGWQGPVTLQPGTPQQFTFTTTIKDIGTIYAWPAINYRGQYLHYNNWGIAMNSHQANLSVTSPLTMSDPNPVAGETVTYSATIKNNEDGPIHIDAIGLPVRYYGAYNYDAAWTTPSGNELAAGASVTLSGPVTVDKPGPYTSWISWNLGGSYTTLSPVTTKSVPLPTPNFTLTYIETPDTTPAVGENVAIKFKLKNNLAVPMTLDAVGIVGRYGNVFTGPNRDFGWVGPETFAANEEKTYTTFTSLVTKTDPFYAWVAINYKGAYTHYNAWGFALTPHMPNLTLSSPLTINSGNPVSVGQTVPVTATIKNNESHPINYSTLGIPIRFYGVYNYDVGWTAPGSLAASGQSGDSVTVSGNVTFDKSGPYTLWTSANLNGLYLTISSPQKLNL